MSASEAGDVSREPKEASSAGSWPSLPLAFLHLAGLWAIAVMQPLLDLLGNNPAFFVARGNTTSDILIFAVAGMLVPPLVMAAIVGLVRLISAPAGRVVLSAFVALLAATFLLQILKRLPLPEESRLLFPLALALGGLVGWAYLRRSGLRTGATVLGFAPALFLILFLGFSPASDLVLPQDDNVQATGTSTSRTPVVVLIVDELPVMSLMDERERVDAKRWPNFARLAKESTWYRNTTTVADGTQVAVPAILSGLRPRNQVATSRHYPRNLFTMLGKRYNQHVEEPITKLCPIDVCTSRGDKGQGERLRSLATDLRIVWERIVLPEDLANDLPPIDRDWESFATETSAGADAVTEIPDKPQLLDGQPIAGTALYAQRVRDGRSVVQSIAPSRGRPGLWMVHYAIPHVPWRFLPNGNQYALDGPDMPGLGRDQTWGANRFLLDQGTQRHLLQLGFADTLVGEVIDRMKDAGIWDEAMLVVVADHGLSLRPKQLRRPVTTANFAEIASVPLFVKFPGQSDSKIDDDQRETIDIMPTLAKALDAGDGWHFDGVPLDEPRAGNYPPRVRSGRLAEIVSVSYETLQSQRAAVLERQLQRFPADPQAVWRVGPAQELVGRPLSSVPQAVATKRGEVDFGALYGDVNPQRTGIMPSYVTGELDDVPAGRPLAVAVNGTIRATSQTYRAKGAIRYSALVPPTDFQPGRNDVQVLLVEGEQLREVARSGS